MGDRFIQVGSALAGVGATFAAGYWIYTKQTKGTEFWSLAGDLSLSLLSFGVILMVIGLILPTQSSGTRSQSQHGGRASINYQAGRDLNLTNRDNESDR